MDTDCSEAKTNSAKVVSGRDSYRSLQGSVYHPGISAETVGAKGLWLGIVTLEPGQRTSAHVHACHETAFYMMSGTEVELWSDDDLRTCEICRPGDYLFIPANVLHVAVNRGKDTAVFIGSRNEPTAHESMILHPDMDRKVP
jgi:uncharacterized RmlC-like cupin family protein